MASLQPSLPSDEIPTVMASNKSKHACRRRKRHISNRLFLRGYNIVLIYHQFACATAMLFANVITIPASTNGGQQGVIAEDRRPRRAGAKEGAPSS